MSEFLSVKEIAGRLHVSVKTVYRWIDKRLLAASKIGRLVRVLKRDYLAFITQKSTEWIAEQSRQRRTIGPKYRTRGFRHLEPKRSESGSREF